MYAFRVALIFVLASLAAMSVASAKGNPHMARGIQLLDQAEDEQALKQFEQALKWPGGRRAHRATIHIYLGITQLNLANDTAAAAHFREALKLDAKVRLPGGVSPKIERFMARIRSEQPAQPVRPKPAPAPSPVVRPVTPVVSRRDRPSPLGYWPAWAALGVGVAAGGAGLALGLLAGKKADEANDLGLPTSEAESTHDTAGKMALSANILFGVAGAAAIASGVLFYVGSRDRDDRGPVAGLVPMEGGALLQLRGATW